MIRWGILGAGNIAQRFAKSLENETRAELYAIGVRSEEKAHAFEEKFNYDTYYLDYNEMLLDPKIDAIYLSLPHQLHKEWAIKALRQGKAVLCEKPAGLNAEEVKEMVAEAKKYNTLFMEAMKSRFLPAYETMKRLVESKEIGDVKHVEAAFCVAMPFDKMQNTYHTQPIVGGVLLDMGIYCASFIEDFLGNDVHVEKVYANVRKTVDYSIDALLKSDTLTARLEASFLESKPRNARVIGTSGSIELVDFHRTQKLIVTKGDKVEEIEVALAYDDFYGEISHFCDLIIAGRVESPKMTFENSINAASILDLIKSMYTDYDQSVLDALLEQEALLTFDTFGSKEALELGNTVVELAQPHGKDVAIQIVREEDSLIIFQYLMDSKSERNIKYMQGKHKAALESGHASVYPGIEYKIKGNYPDSIDLNVDALPVGGAFPIRVNDEWVATLLVSGLHEGKDHELMVDALSKILNKKAPTIKHSLF